MLEQGLKIHYCDYEREITPWHQPDLMTPYWRFYWNETPGGYLLCQGRRIDLGPESFTVIPGYLKFSTDCDRPFQQFYIHFNLNEQLVLTRSEIRQLPADADLVAEIRSFCRLPAAEGSRLARTLLAYRILSGALLRLPREWLPTPEKLDSRVVRACEYIQNHLDDPPDNTALAALVKLNRSGFVRLFSAETGEPPQQYVRRKRIELACELLHFSDRTIDEIAELTGFADRFHFSRVFRQVIRSTPAGFRHRKLRSTIK